MPDMELMLMTVPVWFGFVLEEAARRGMRAAVVKKCLGRRFCFSPIQVLAHTLRSMDQELTP